MYHGVTDRRLEVWNWCQLFREDFQRQIEFLSHEYKVLPLSEVAERLIAGSPLPEHAACVTFDDGFRNNLTVAYPILATYQVPATIFVVTSLMDSNQPPWPERLYNALTCTAIDLLNFEGAQFSLASSADRSVAFQKIMSRLKASQVGVKDALMDRLLADLGEAPVKHDSALAMLSWQEVAKLNASGLITFGSHTHTHQILARCTTDRQRFELSISRSFLLERLGNADLFAYPNGKPEDYTAETRALLSSCGYKCAVSTSKGLNNHTTSIYELNRMGVGADMGFAEFEAALLGW
jgi:peptidoglycan/xylan/chitin deacetylase (PgdA/CDA1 family)